MVGGVDGVYQEKKKRIFYLFFSFRTTRPCAVRPVSGTGCVKPSTEGNTPYFYH